MDRRADPTVRAGSLGVAAAALLALIGASIPAEALAEERRIATLAPRGSAWMKVLERGAQKVAEVTEGRFTTKYYPGGTQGDERDVVRKMRLGQLDGAAVTSVGLSLIYEGIRVLELPRMFETVEELDYVRHKMWPYFTERFEDKGFRLGAPGDVGWIQFFSQEPVGELSDLRKAKVWLWTDDPLAKAMFKELNVNSVPMGVPDVLPSLTSGRINAAYNSALGAVALQWSTKVRYVTAMRMSYAIGATVLTNESWNKVSAADKKAMEKIYRKQASKLRKTVRRDNGISMKQMTRKGVKVVQSSPAMVRDFDDAAHKVWKQLIGKVYSQKELDMVLQYRAEYRAKNQK